MPSQLTPYRNDTNSWWIVSCTPLGNENSARRKAFRTNSSDSVEVGEFNQFKRGSLERGIWLAIPSIGSNLDGHLLVKVVGGEGEDFLHQGVGVLDDEVDDVGVGGFLDFALTH